MGLRKASLAGRLTWFCWVSRDLVPGKFPGSLWDLWGVWLDGVVEREEVIKFLTVRRCARPLRRDVPARGAAGGTSGLRR